jgi:hypothetical protein
MSRLTESLRRFFRFRDAGESDSAEPDPEWWNKLDKPFFRSTAHAAAYVSAEIARTIPDGWKACEVPSGKGVGWIIEKQTRSAGDCASHDYVVRLPGSLDVVILSHGNCDAGTYGLHHALQSALVIDSVMLRLFSLGECLAHLFNNCEPNERNAT